jgi:hypothetical protein
MSIANPLDWQIDSATQVCSALGKVVSAVEELTLDLNADGMPSNWENTFDNMLWHELLLPFIGVKKLHIGRSLARQNFSSPGISFWSMGPAAPARAARA